MKLTSKNKRSPKNVIGEHKVGARGKFSVMVVNPDGTLDESKCFPENQNVPNLILDSGLDRIGQNTTGETTRFASQLNYCAVGTGSTPTRHNLDGTFERSGTTVTRSAGSGEFSAGMVGMLIKFGSGEEAYVASFTSSTEVETSDSGSISAVSVIVYAVNQTGLTTEIKRSNTYPQYNDIDGRRASESYADLGDGSVSLKRTYDHSAEGPGGETYYECGVSALSGSGNNLFSRVVFPVPVFVDNGQQIRISYTLTLTVAGGIPGTEETVDGGISGWPINYNIESIDSTGSDFTVELDRSHHHVAGQSINISGSSESDYDGEWVIESVTSDTITILDTSNPGPASGGILFGNTRRKYVAVNSGVASLRGYGSPSGPVTASFGDVATGPSTATNHRGILDGGENASEVRGIARGSTTFPSLGIFGAWTNSSGNVSYADGSTQSGRSSISLTASPDGNSSIGTFVKETYVDGNFFVDRTKTYPAGAINDNLITSILFFRESASGGDSNVNSIQGYVLFEQPQRKDSTHTLSLTFRFSWGRDLSTPSN